VGVCGEVPDEYETMIKLKINNQEVRMEPGVTILQACELHDVVVPRFLLP